MKAIILAALVAAAAPASATVNLVANGDFDDGTASWTSASWAAAGTYNQLHSDAGGFVVSACEGSACRLAQAIHTSPGRRYTLSFALAPVPGSDAGTTIVSFGDAPVATITAPAPGWATYSVGVVATGTTTVVAFDAPPGPGASAIDTVTVTAAVPEPATWGLMLAGFGAIGVALRRRRGAATFAAGRRAATFAAGRRTAAFAAD